MMAHAIDNPAPTTIILISGDRDFVYAVSILSLRQYRVVLLASRAAYSGLKAQASAVYNWPDDFLPELPPAAPHCHPSQVNGVGSSRPQNSLKGGPIAFDRRWSSASTSPPASPAHSDSILESSVDGDTLGMPDDVDCAESGTPVPDVTGDSTRGGVSVLEQLEEPVGNVDSQEPTTVSFFTSIISQKDYQ